MAKFLIDSDLIIDSAELEFPDLTQKDHDAFRIWFDLATPDPEFSGFTVDDADQLPGRPTEGRLEIAAIFDHPLLLVTNEQQKGKVSGWSIFEELKGTEALFLGPNLGEFLYQNQHLIPVELHRDVSLVFWGKIYRDSGRNRCVRCLFRAHERLGWYWDWFDLGNWDDDDRAVVLEKP